MPVDEILGVEAGDDVAVERPLVHLRQRVVHRLAVAERLVQRRVEAVQEAQLELVRALEEVLQLARAERDVRRLVAGLGLESRRVAGTPGSVVSMTGLRAKSKNGDRFVYRWFARARTTRAGTSAPA